MRLATIKDVAAAAGVSIAAVSKVLHDRGGTIRVSEATAHRIRDVARGLNYRPNYHARSLRSGQSRAVGLVASPRPSLAARGPYYGHVLQLLTDALNDSGYALLLTPQGLPVVADAVLADGRYDGVIWLDTTIGDSLARLFNDPTLPSVAINGHDGGTPPSGGTLAGDEAKGISLALDHLFDLGHRRVRYFDHSADDLPLARRRSDLFVSIAETKRIEGTVVPWRPGAECEGATAAIAWNPVVAGGLLRDAAHAGRAVPERLSVIAFDGVESPDASWPGVTTVASPMRQIVGRAVSRLVSLIAGEDAFTGDESYPPKIVDGGTTGPPRS